MTILQLINQRVQAALAATGAPDAPAVVQPASKPEFGDYQANGVMGAAKQLKTNPRELAQKWSPRWILPASPTRWKSPARVSSIFI